MLSEPIFCATSDVFGYFLYTTWYATGFRWKIPIVPSLMVTLSRSFSSLVLRLYGASYMEGFYGGVSCKIWDVRGSAFLSSSNLDTLCWDSGTCISSQVLVRSRNLLCWTKSQNLMLIPQVNTWIWELWDIVLAFHIISRDLLLECTWRLTDCFC